MLTRHGWGAVLLAVLTAVVGRLFGVLELFVLGAGLVALVAACVLWVNARVISIGVQRYVVPDAMQVGDVGRVELRVTNTGTSSLSPLTLWEPVSGMGGATLRLAPLRRGETTTANYRLPATRRGTVVFGPLTVERRDPFGLSVKRRTIPGTHEIVILPAHLKLSLPVAAGGAGPMGQYLRMRALGRVGSEFHSLRDYADGDDLRRIHWRASARSETLKVREVEPDGLRRCTIALDTAADEYSPEGFERAVSAAASSVASAARAGLQLRLLIGGGVDLRNTTVSAALHELADCAVEERRPISFAGPAGDGLGLTIVITGEPRSAAVLAARRHLSPNDVLVVIACSSMTATSTGFVLDATGDTTFASAWSALTGTHVERAAS
ncbi:MAG TPA: DUF58 domain-containing protein [Ilumatobacteraceae bacterium]